MRVFDIPAKTATHFQLCVVTEQWTGSSAYRGKQDSDPTDSADCATGTVGSPPATCGRTVRAAELQLFCTRPSW